MSIIIYINTHANLVYTHRKPTYIPTPMTMGMIPTVGMGMGKPSDTHGYTHTTPYLYTILPFALVDNAIPCSYNGRKVITSLYKLQNTHIELP